MYNYQLKDLDMEDGFSAHNLFQSIDNLDNSNNIHTLNIPDGATMKNGESAEERKFLFNREAFNTGIYCLSLNIIEMTGNVYIYRRAYDENNTVLEYFSTEFNPKLGYENYLLKSKVGYSKKNSKVAGEEIGIFITNKNNITSEVKIYTEANPIKQKNSNNNIVPENNALVTENNDLVTENNDLVTENNNSSETFYKMDYYSVYGFNDEGVDREDMLDFEGYSDILSNIITAKSISPPVAIGIYSSWGSGKSFLLELIKKKFNELKNIESTSKYSCCTLYDNYLKTRNQNYIIIEFNAWEYSGSDVLWAGLVKCLYDKLEDEFGSNIVRLVLTLNQYSVCKICDNLHIVIGIVLFLVIGIVIYYFIHNEIARYISLFSGIVLSMLTLYNTIKNFVSNLWIGRI